MHLECFKPFFELVFLSLLKKNNGLESNFILKISFFSQEERQKRLGPGGLDPVEVFESLPKVFTVYMDNLSEEFS